MNKNKITIIFIHILFYHHRNIFGKIKNNNHIMVQQKKSIINYLSFVYISFLEIYLEYNNKQNITLHF